MRCEVWILGVNLPTKHPLVKNRFNSFAREQTTTETPNSVETGAPSAEVTSSDKGVTVREANPKGLNSLREQRTEL